jgi:hypothetical protein
MLRSLASTRWQLSDPIKCVRHFGRLQPVRHRYQITERL